MKEAVRTLILKPLPRQSAAIVLMASSVPIGLAISSLRAAGKQDHAVSTFYLAVVSIMVSSFLAIYSYYVPKAVRSRTTLVTLPLWLLLFLAFGEAAFNFESQIGYGLGVTFAVGSLFTLVVCFLYSGMLAEIGQVDSTVFEPGAFEVLLSVFVYGVAVLCIVIIVTIPFTLAVARPGQAVFFVSTSVLHFVAFLFWALAASVVAVLQLKDN